MGKLFDRIDHLWELDQINRAEMAASMQERGPDSPRPMTGFEIARLDAVGRSDKLRIMRSLVGPAVGAFQKLRIQSRMKLLKTGQLMADARFADAQIRACPHCRTDGGQHKYCVAHKHFGIVFKRLKWAGEDNMATRLAQGRAWGDDEPLLAEERGLNEWERWYFRDKQEGVWPGTHAYTGSQDDIQRLRQEYGSLDYRGWLQMLFEEEEISYPDYLAEKARLNVSA